MRKRGKSSFFLLALLGLIISEQLIKLLARQTGLYIVNRKVLFGLVDRPPDLIIIELLALIIIIFFVFKFNQPGWSRSLAYLFLTAGSIINIIDIFIYGGVVDYWSIFNLGVLNLADIYITIGVCLFLLTRLKIKS